MSNNEGGVGIGSRNEKEQQGRICMYRKQEKSQDSDFTRLRGCSGSKALKQ